MYRYELLRHAAIPPAVQLELLDEPGLIHNPQLSDHTIGQLAKRKLSASDMLCVIGRPMSASLVLELAATEKRAGVLAALVSANASGLAAADADALLGILLAKKSLPATAVGRLCDLGEVNCQLLVEHLDRLPGMLRLQAMVNCDCDVDDDVLIAAWGDGSWLPNSEFRERQVALVNLAYYRPALQPLFASCAHSAPALALAGLPISDDIARALAARDEQAERFMFLALLWNPFVNNDVFAGRTFTDHDLRAAATSRDGQDNWPIPVGLITATAGQIAYAVKRAAGLKPRPVLAAHLLEVAPWLLEAGTLNDDQLKMLQERIESLGYMLPRFARRSPSQDTEPADDEQDWVRRASERPAASDWQDRKANGAQYWTFGNPQLVGFCQALGEDAQVWRTAAALLPDFSGTLGELAELARAI